MGQTTTVPPVPYNAPMVGEDGRITPIWSKWIETMYIRAGQAVAYPNNLLIADPTTALGDTIYKNASLLADRVAGNTTATKKFYSQTGTGTVSASPAWSTIAAADVPNLSTPTSSVMSWDANKNLSANSFLQGYQTTATAAGTTTLTVSSQGLQYFTGSTTQTCKLPAANTLVLGQQFCVVNNSSGVVTVQDGGASTVQAMSASTHAIFTVTNVGSTAGAWDVNYITNSAGTPTPTPNTNAQWDANNNFSANEFIPGFTTTATAAGTTTMTIASSQVQVWTGSSTQTVKLPTTSVVAGAQYLIVNLSSGAVTVQSSGANTIQVLAANSQCVFTALVATPTTAANWNATYTPAISGTQPVANGGTGLTTLTANNVILGNGTSTPLFVAPSTSGNVLTSNGTTWTSTAPSAGSAPNSEIYLTGGNGYGSTDTCIRKLVTTVTNVGSDISITTSNDATHGCQITINTTGIYAISYTDSVSAGVGWFGISRNSAQLTTAIYSITNANRLGATTASAVTSSVSAIVHLTATDVIRPHADATTNGTTDYQTNFRVTRIA